MPTKCQICRGEFHDSPDMVILCEHKKGPVHLGCCIDSCSWEKKPCQHCRIILDKVKI